VADPNETQRRYKEFIDLLPLTLSLAGLPPSEHGRYFSEEQIEAIVAAVERALALDLRAGQVRYRLVEEVALEGTWDWDITTGHVYYSRTWKSLLGLADDEVGTGIEEWTSRVHADDQRAVRSAIAEQLAGTCQPLDLEHRLLAADGREVWVRARATTVTDDAGVRARMVGVLMVLGLQGEPGAAPWRTSRVRPQADASAFPASQ
jgi:PAS domain S-box-containing protein